MFPKDDLHETRKFIDPTAPSTLLAMETLPTTTSSSSDPNKKQLFGTSIRTIIEKATNIISGNRNNNDNSDRGLYDNTNDNASITSDDDTWTDHSPKETFVAFPSVREIE